MKTGIYIGHSGNAHIGQFFVNAEVSSSHKTETDQTNFDFFHKYLLFI